MRDWSGLHGPVAHPLVTISEPVPEPVGAHAVLARFVQETVMLNAVKSLRSVNHC